MNFEQFASLISLFKKETGNATKREKGATGGRASYLANRIPQITYSDNVHTIEYYYICAGTLGHITETILPKESEQAEHRYYSSHFGRIDLTATSQLTVSPRSYSNDYQTPCEI